MYLSPWNSQYHVALWTGKIYYTPVLYAQPNVYSLRRDHLPSITRIYKNSKHYLCIF